jgi:hypothetical protein
MKEAAALFQLNEIKGLEYLPTKDGFLLSNDQIQAPQIPSGNCLIRLHPLLSAFISWKNTPTPGSANIPNQRESPLPHNRANSWYHSLATGLARRRNTPPGQSVKHI